MNTNTDRNNCGNCGIGCKMYSGDNTHAANSCVGGRCVGTDCLHAIPGTVPCDDRPGGRAVNGVGCCWCGMPGNVQPCY